MNSGRTRDARQRTVSLRMNFALSSTRQEYFMFVSALLMSSLLLHGCSRFYFFKVFAAICGPLPTQVHTDRLRAGRNALRAAGITRTFSCACRPP